jgi:hypothetical protein
MRHHRRHAHYVAVASAPHVVACPHIMALAAVGGLQMVVSCLQRLCALAPAGYTAGVCCSGLVGCEAVVRRGQDHAQRVHVHGQEQAGQRIEGVQHCFLPPQQPRRHVAFGFGVRPGVPCLSSHMKQQPPAQFC